MLKPKALVVTTAEQSKKLTYFDDILQIIELHHFSVTVVSTYCKAISFVMREKPEMLVVTENICEKIHNEFSLISRAREASNLPIILLLENIDSELIKRKRAEAYRQGADDVIINPLDAEEIFFRIDRLLKRTTIYNRLNTSRQIQVEALTVNPDKGIVRWQDSPISLTQTETDLLHLLVKFRGEYLSKPYLQMHLLKRPYTQHDRSIDMHVSNLRRKLGKAGHPENNIFAVRGYGYCYR
ncbi:winged helix-turn-helix domain-containing protein [Aliikangiella sp. IMCC44359]|uniref:winged helix-turn-helix domain-containing protein n=1 Tax=Aliikangiella sp. IMCC44359 TaxID=3459125 RepID=UPI00403ABAA2